MTSINQIIKNTVANIGNLSDDVINVIIDYVKYNHDYEIINYKIFKNEQCLYSRFLDYIKFIDHISIKYKKVGLQGYSNFYTSKTKVYVNDAFNKLLTYIRNNQSTFYLIGPNYMKLMNFESCYNEDIDKIFFTFEFIMLCIHNRFKYDMFRELNIYGIDIINYNEIFNIPSNIDFSKNTYYVVSIPNSCFKIIICIMAKKNNIKYIKYDHDYDSFCVRMDGKIFNSPIDYPAKNIDLQLYKENILVYRSDDNNYSIYSCYNMMLEKFIIIKTFYIGVFNNIAKIVSNTIKDNLIFKYIDFKYANDSIDIVSNYDSNNHNKTIIKLNKSFIKSKIIRQNNTQFYVHTQKFGPIKIDAIISDIEIIQLLNKIFDKETNIKNMDNVLKKISHQLDNNPLQDDNLQNVFANNIEIINNIKKLINDNNSLTIIINDGTTSNVYYHLLLIYLENIFSTFYGHLLVMNTKRNIYTNLGYNIMDSNKIMKFNEYSRSISFIN